MATLKIHLLLASIAIVQANFSSEDFDQPDDSTRLFRDLVQPGATQLTSNYRGENNYRYPADDPHYGSSTKSIPREDKSFKKPIHSYHAKADGFKALFKPGSPYCSEVKNERSANRSLTCYRCKDPNTGINYERCSKSAKIGNLRTRRSHPESDEDSGSLPDEYHFSEEYFLPQASKPAVYKNKNDKCEKVVENSMVCMVCMNPRTHGKYKQCSYVHEPKDRAYEYSKSSSKKPVRGRETHQTIRQQAPESREDNWENERPKNNYGEKAAESRNCKKVQKDGQVCTVCKNPKTGGNSEKCYYEYQPSDKVYKFSKSKSFGYPYSDFYRKKDSDESVEKSESKPRASKVNKPFFKDFSYGSYEDEEPSSESKEPSSESKEHYEYNPSSSIYDSEAEKVAEESKTADCKEVRRDSMVCSVCKDPKTGANSERCTYSYQPKDKAFSYSKKKSFGNPTSNYKDGNYGGGDSGQSDESLDSSNDRYEILETKPKKSAKRKPYVFVEPKPDFTRVDQGYLDTTNRKTEIEKFLEDFKAEDRFKCQKVIRDKMTCYQCVDNNGFQKEECMYVTEPIVSDQTKKKVKREPAKNEKDLLLEPMAMASSNYATIVRVRRDEEKDDREKVNKQQETQEVDPYDSVAETRYRYDKVLGFLLPEYMLETSESEAEFDKTVSSGF